MDTSTERAHTVARLLEMETINTDVGRAICANLIRALVGEREKLQAAIEMARQCIDADDVIGAHQILVRALGEKE